MIIYFSPKPITFNPLEHSGYLQAHKCWDQYYFDKGIATLMATT